MEEFDEEAKKIRELLRETTDILEDPAGIKIMNSIPDKFTKAIDKIETETGLPAFKLHHHLCKLWEAGFIFEIKAPMSSYGRTDLWEILLALAKKIESETLK